MSLPLKRLLKACGIGALWWSMAIPARLAAEERPPHAAAAAGYRLNTFSASFTPEQIDLEGTREPGFQWYPWSFFSAKPLSRETTVLNDDRSLTLVGDENTVSNAILATATFRVPERTWHGVAFGGGGYFEAELKFNPEDVITGGEPGWPSFWSMAIEHLALLPAEQWSGQAPGYTHFIEVDFFEYSLGKTSPKRYGGAIHDWYGVFRETCPGPGYCSVNNAGKGTKFNNFQIHTPRATDFRRYHKFGLLWVPATEERMGFARYYFDGRPTTDYVTWSRYTGDEPAPPGDTPWTFGVLDRQHLALILGTGRKQPMTVRSVRVWQRDENQNQRQ